MVRLSMMQSALNNNEPVQWPNITNESINEFHTPGLATQAFPTLFPFSTTCSNWCHPVSLTEAFKHLIKYADVVIGQLKKWCFATHPQFLYWAVNMKQCYQLLSQTSDLTRFSSIVACNISTVKFWLRHVSDLTRWIQKNVVVCVISNEV